MPTINNDSINLPSFFVIGAQKAGSTFVLHCLQEHPDLFVPRYEIPFFEDPDYNSSRLDILREHFQAARTDQLCGLKRPNYLGEKIVSERILAHLPHAQHIAVLRDPVERFVSGYFHSMRSGFLPVAPFDEGARRLLDGEYDRDYPHAQRIISYGLYHHHLSRWRDCFGAEKLCVILFDDILREPHELAKRLYSFLSVADDFFPTHTHRKQMPGIYSIPRLKISAALQKITHNHYHNNTRMRIKTNPVSKLIYYGFQAVDRAVLRRILPDSKPELPSDVQQRLSEIYAPDVQALADEWSLEVSDWIPSRCATA